ncbi:MAG: response regulator transcription factor [Acidimicrobiales bacterium]
MTRVVLAEDQTMVRGALVSLLGLEPDIEVVGEAADGAELVRLVSEMAPAPEVAVVDIEMPVMDGIEAAAELTRSGSACRVLMLTTFGRPGYMQRALSAGARGFLLKEAPAAELSAAVRRVASGELVVDPALAMSALVEGQSLLSAREAEVLSAARAGGTVAELSSMLHLSRGTVRNHLSSAMQKLGARTRAEAALMAEEKGWL